MAGEGLLWAPKLLIEDALFCLFVLWATGRDPAAPGQIEPPES